MTKPSNIQSIGSEIAILWQDGREDYLSHSYLREESPSASNKGEVDILGQKHGGAPTGTRFPNVTIQGWNYVGNYAICFHFSDGHRSGLYSWDYLRKLAENYGANQS